LTILAVKLQQSQINQQQLQQLLKDNQQLPLLVQQPVPAQQKKLQPLLPKEQLQQNQTHQLK
jgi:hypothetical protein